MAHNYIPEVELIDRTAFMGDDVLNTYPYSLKEDGLYNGYKIRKN